MALSIRSVTPGDRAQWEPLWAGYNLFYGRPAMPPEVTDTAWQRFLDPAEPVHALVAERGGALLGLAHYLYHRSTTQIALSCYLQDLFTTEAARGLGVGRALIEAVADRARVAQAGRFYWQTHESNTTAMALYDKLAERSGFVVYKKPI